MTMSALRAPSTQVRGFGQTRSVAVARPLSTRGAFRVRAADNDQVNIKSASTTTTTTTPKPSTTSKLVEPTIEQTGQEKYTKRETYAEGNIPVTTTPETDLPYELFNPITETINGRAAMLGFIAAITTEAWTHQGVWHQIHGKYLGDQLVQNPSGLGIISFVYVVTLVVLSTLIPKRIFGEDARDRAWGPFTVRAEVWNGRFAQLGFAALLLTEALKNGPLFG